MKNLRTGETLARTLEVKEKEFQKELRTYLKFVKHFQRGSSLTIINIFRSNFGRKARRPTPKFGSPNSPRKITNRTTDFTKLKGFQTLCGNRQTRFRQRTINSLKNMNLEKTQREVVYPFGAGEAMLLDRAGINWKAALFDREILSR